MLGDVCAIHDSDRIPMNSRERKRRKEKCRELYPYYGATGQVDSIDDYIFEGEYVLLGEDGAPFLDLFKNKAYLVNGKFWVNNHAHILTGFSNVLDNIFLCYYLNQFNYSEFVTGTTRLKLTQARLRNIPIYFPTLLEQKRIVAKIESLFSRLDSAKDSLERVRQEIKRYRQSVLKSAFEGRLFESAVEFESRKVEDISENIQYGYTASAKNASSGIRLLRITDIQNGKVHWDRVPFCNIEKSKIDKYQLFSNDILFARTGATVGKTFLIEGDIPKSVFASYLIRLKLKENILPKYVYSYFQSNSYWRQITVGKVGIGQPNVNGTRLGRLGIPMCGLKEQIKIVQAIESRFERTKVLEDTVEQGLEKIERLKQSILKKAFEGQLVEPDSNGESVEVLFERIKKEKASLSR
jgi:type I restriction enzyme S subunit